MIIIIEIIIFIETKLQNTIGKIIKYRCLVNRLSPINRQRSMADRRPFGHVMTADCIEMIKMLKNNSGGKMQLAICWSGNSHLHQQRQDMLTCTQFMDVLICVSHTTTLSENLLLAIVTHSNDLLMSPNTPARVWHLQ